MKQLLMSREERYQSHAVISISTDQTPIGKTVEMLTRQVEKYQKEQMRLSEKQEGWNRPSQLSNE